MFFPKKLYFFLQKKNHKYYSKIPIVSISFFWGVNSITNKPWGDGYQTYQLGTPKPEG